MLKSDSQLARSLHEESLTVDLCIVGGGMAGVCCAITAAREGLQVVLVTDRPVLGGNASSEVRLWTLGATSHMGNNNRWAREGGVIDEILVENVYRNPEGNPLVFDTVLLDKVVAEPNIHLLLNTPVYQVEKSGPDTIASVRGFCSQNSTQYNIAAPLFCDASGDGIVGFLAGAAFRMGAESKQEFDEQFAPDNEYGSLLGHSLFFYTKDVGQPVRYVAPSFALEDVTQIPRYRHFNTKEQGCQLWWIEYGGRLDTIHDSEQIKWELWRVVYGVWNHIKNSGEFPEAENLTLEWVGHISGKRESRRFEGDYLLTQPDLVEQRTFPDAVSFGGWAIDLHPADGVYSDMAPCTQWHTKGVYQIPYRAMYSRNIENLFLGGRLLSASHVAFGSTRVMATCAHNAQAIAMAAAICREENVLPREVAQPERIEALQRRLQRTGQYIPQVVRPDPLDRAQTAQLTASSQLQLAELKPSGRPRPLTESLAMLLPVPAGRVPAFTFFADVEARAEVVCELRTSSRRGSFTPDVLLASRTAVAAPAQPRVIATPHSRRKSMVGAMHRTASDSRLSHSAGNGDGVATRSGPQTLQVDFDVTIDEPSYLFVCLKANERVAIYRSDQLVTGIVSLSQASDPRVSEGNVQSPPENIGIDSFEFWCPQRRPAGKNLAMRLSPPLEGFGPEQAINGVPRPTERANAWVAAWDDPAPRLTLEWDAPQTLGRIELSFDTDFDHPMETVLMGHPERVMPHCVRGFRILDEAGNVLAEQTDNHQTRQVVRFDSPVVASRIHVELTAPSQTVPAALMEIRCYQQ